MLSCLLLFVTISWGQEARIKPGDALQIYVHQQEELCQTVIVKDNGTIEYPLLYGIPVDGITITELQQLLNTQISKYFGQATMVAIRIAPVYPIHVEVIGQVVRPGLHTVLNTTSLLGIIGMVGGVAPGAQLSQVKIIRKENGKSIEHICDVTGVIMKGDLTMLPLLKDEDVIFIPGNPETATIKVLGGVMRPGTFEINFQTNLLDVLFLAGGPTRNAKLKEIRIISDADENVKQVKIDVNEIINKNNINLLPVINPGDIIYIPERTITWMSFVNWMRDLTVFATLFYLISQSNNR